ncbi:RNA polymerase sigma factor, sigma-70 family [Proteiniclasticum ruminis]|jgi:RNA polymerase sporulation-specific sigma factor|uniref:RNA polymerase sigma factor, sigma-70 family n=1 Tax=Proteiniclasticum ruminis TaxID=398199 RepID=A0A1G8GEZ3_9CLOT|nr:sigma-70 family RNA polymerase sigma factor [Proteiniclasticum ruminis]MBP9920530.1 sigma-70 family RNA polymerase sigma factor [Proteiniclasticum sp.]SDH92953.1 RNA polymerase sigma factor, sigma-70 family [Proteiniclasticum ruminis]
MIDIYCNEKLIEQIRNGDTNAEVEIIESNKALIYKIIKDYYYASKNALDMEDVYQAGCLGLLKAVRNFKPELGNKFVTYAYYLIRGEVQRIYEEHTKRELTMSDIQIRNSDGLVMESQEAMDYIRYDRKNWEDEWNHQKTTDDKIMVDDLLKKVTPLQKKILVYRYYDDLSQKEIGELINKSQVFVSREEKRARKKLISLLDQKECIY